MPFPGRSLCNRRNLCMSGYISLGFGALLGLQAISTALLTVSLDALYAAMLVSGFTCNFGF